MKKLIGLIACVMLLGLSSVFAQSKTVTGTVIDQAGLGMPGVSVAVKGTNEGAYTDIDGKWKLTVTPKDVLVISFVGMKTQEIIVGKKTVINVTLEEDRVAVEEVMVVAYGTAKKSSFTGSAKVVGAKTIAKRQVSSVTNALAGTATGVTVTSASGQPGEDATVRIRGIGSLNASSAPLYVVDGMPFEGKLSNINSSDIASMTILKDASATSLYGARGANGVILITTKKGKSGKAVIKFNSKFGINTRAVEEYDIMTDPKEYYEAYWMAIRNKQLILDNPKSLAEAGQFASDQLIQQLSLNVYGGVDDASLVDPLTGKLNPNAKLLYKDDWDDETFANGLRHEHDVSISGGDDKGDYYMSVGYLNDEGYIKNSDFERYSMRLNVNRQVRDWLKVGLNTAWTHSSQNYARQSTSAYVNGFFFTRNIAPIYPVYLRKADGSFDTASDGSKQYDFGDTYGRPFAGTINPLAVRELNQEETITDVLTVGNTVDVRIMKGLNFISKVSAYLLNSRKQELTTPLYGSGASYGGGVSNNSKKSFNLNTNQLLTYNTKIDDFEIDLLAGHESTTYRYNYMYGYKQKMFLPDVPEFDNAIDAKSLSGYTRDYRLEGYLSRAKVNYMQKYYFSASFRRDGSSRFHKDNRWGNFWSVGGTWRITKEDFMQDISFISDLKYKVSYGTQGNDALLTPGGYALYYAYQNTYEVKKSGDDLAIAITTIGNKDLTWETSKNFNTGIEFGLFNNRIRGGVEYYTRTAADLLQNLKQPGSTGITYIPTNIGDMVNSGWEVELSADIVKHDDLLWNVSLNASTFKNEITKLPIEYKDGLSVYPYRYMEGRSMYDYYLPVFVGVVHQVDVDAGDFASNELGKAIFEKEVITTVEGEEVTVIENVTTTEDLNYEYCGSALPDLQGGFSTNFEFKGFDLSAIFSFQIGGNTLDGPYNSLTSSNVRAGTNMHKDIWKSWSPENPDSDIPMVATEYQDGGTTTQRNLVDASYLSLQSLVLGYNLPTSLLSRTGISKVRIFAASDNVWLWSKRKGLDPRQSIGNVDFRYSPIRTISFGINVTF